MTGVETFIEDFFGVEVAKGPDEKVARRLVGVVRMLRFLDGLDELIGATTLPMVTFFDPSADEIATVETWARSHHYEFRRCVTDYEDRTRIRSFEVRHDSTVLVSVQYRRERIPEGE